VVAGHSGQPATGSAPASGATGPPWHAAPLRHSGDRSQPRHTPCGPAWATTAADTAMTHTIRVRVRTIARRASL
jgi:hypothetical protein